MSDPFILTAITAVIIRNAPVWLEALGSTLLGKAIDKGEGYLVDKVAKDAGDLFKLPKKEQLHHLEQALKNATERGLAKFQRLEERDLYRAILETLSQSNPDSETLCQEALRLFTLSDSPDFAALSEKYNQRQRISALARNEEYKDIDITPYLNSFFSALTDELYADPYFRAQMSEAIQVRASKNMQNSLLEIVDILSQNYTREQFARDLEEYRKYIKRTFRHLKITGVVPKGQNTDPELDGIFVPLRIASQDPTTPEEQIESSIIDMLEQHPYLVLLGKPGSGKSTATRHLAWSHGVANQDTSSASTSPLLSGNPLPLRIKLHRLTEVRGQNPEYDFLSYATKVMLSREGVEINQQMFKELLKRGALLLLFDGLDEVATLDERKRLVEEIESYARNYPGNRIVVTSRPVGYELGSLSDQLFAHAQLQDFNDEQIWLFLEKWYIQVLGRSPIPYQDQQEIETLFKTLRENSRLHRLAENPLLLTVITAQYRSERLPDRRVEVYDECAKILLDRWAELRGTSARWKNIRMGKADQYACVAHLGFVLHERSQEKESNSAGSPKDIATDVPTRFIRQEIVRFLDAQKLIAETVEQRAEAERFLEMMQAEAGLIVERGKNESGESLYGFIHRTFQEYFAAVYIYTDYLQEENPDIIINFLKDHLHSPHWHEVILLLLGKLLSKPVTGRLRQILNGEIKSDRSYHTDVIQQDLFFVCECLVEEIAVENDLAEYVISLLSNLVKNSPFPSQRKEALDYLALLMQTQQYVSLARKELIAAISNETISDIDTKIQAAAILYPKERQAIQVLSSLVERTDLTIEQQIQSAETLYQCSLSSPEEGRPTIQMLSHLAQRPDLTIEQQIQVAEALYLYSLSSSEEQQQAIRMLWNLSQRQDLSIEQQLQIAEALNGCSPPFSKERQQAIRMFWGLSQHQNLSISQELRIAEALYHCSLSASDEEQQAVRRFFLLAQLLDFPIELRVQIAAARHRYSPSSSKERQQAIQMFSRLAQRPDLTIEQQIQVAEAQCRCSPAHSSERQRTVQMFSRLAQRPDLTIEQQIRAAEALREHSLISSEEEQQALQRLTRLSQRPDLSPEQQMQVAEGLYRCSFPSSEEEQQAHQKLTRLSQRQELSLEQQVQAAEALFRCSPLHLKNEQPEPAFEILSALSQRRDLSLEQQVQVAEALYRYNYSDEPIRERHIQRLLELSQDPDLSIELQVQIAATLYRHNPSASKERQQAVRKLRDLARRSDLSIEQQVQVAEALYHFSPSSSKRRRWLAGQILSRLAQSPELSIKQRQQVFEVFYRNNSPRSKEHRQLDQILSDLTQRSDLNIEQQVSIITASYHHRPHILQEEQQSIQKLSDLSRRPGLSIEQIVQIAEALFRISFSSSKGEQQDIKWLSDLAKRSDLSIEQQVQVAEALYHFSPSSSEELRWQAVQKLSDLSRLSSLSIEQQIQVAAALYRSSFPSSEEQRQALQKLLHLAQNDHLTAGQRMQAIRVLLAAETANYSDKIQAVKLTLTLLQGEDAKRDLEEHWQVIRNDHTRLDGSDIQYIIELTKQDALPTRIRDDMYQILRQMVPQFRSA